MIELQELPSVQPFSMSEQDLVSLRWDLLKNQVYDDKNRGKVENIDRKMQALFKITFSIEEDKQYFHENLLTLLENAKKQFPDEEGARVAFLEEVLRKSQIIFDTTRLLSLFDLSPREKEKEKFCVLF